MVLPIFHKGLFLGSNNFVGDEDLSVPVRSVDERLQVVLGAHRKLQQSIEGAMLQHYTTVTATARTSAVTARVRVIVTGSEERWQSLETAFGRSLAMCRQ